MLFNNIRRMKYYNICRSLLFIQGENVYRYYMGTIDCGRLAHCTYTHDFIFNIICITVYNIMCVQYVLTFYNIMLTVYVILFICLAYARRELSRFGNEQLMI